MRWGGLGLVLLLAGCPIDRNGDGVVRVLCLGDSNTAVTGTLTKWCEYTAAQFGPPWAFVNRALIATATDPVLAQSAVDETHPDMVLIAWGTNDVRADYFDKTAEETTADLLALRQALLDQHLGVLLALIPPQFGVYAANESTLELVNAQLRAAIPAAGLLDFWTGFGLADFPDGLHCTDTAQHRRADLTRQALLR